MIQPHRVRNDSYGAAMTISTTALITHPNDLITCADGSLRPRWASRGQLSWRYFDQEWGYPPTSERGFFEVLSLVVFQLGLTWQSVLRKRDGLREAFAGFDVESVATYGEPDIERLLGDPGIFRNRRKIEATVTNATAMVRLTEPYADIIARHGSGPILNTDRTVPTFTPDSVALSQELKQLGFTHIGPTAAFSLMQAIGAVPVRAQYDLMR